MRTYSASRLEHIDAGFDLTERGVWEQIVRALEGFKP